MHGSWKEINKNVESVGRSWNDLQQLTLLERNAAQVNQRKWISDTTQSAWLAKERVYIAQ